MVRGCPIWRFKGNNATFGALATLQCHIHLNTYCVNIDIGRERIYFGFFLVVRENFFLFLEHLEIPRPFVGLRMKYSIPLLFQEKTFRFFLFCDFNDRVRQRHEMLMKRKAAWKSHFRTDVPQNCPTRHLPELIVGRHTTMTNCQPPAFSLVVGTFSNFVDKSL